MSQYVDKAEAGPVDACANDLYNPCKIFPTGKGCGEVSQSQVQRVMAQVGPDAYV